jgi:hypothetical protein
MLPDHDEQGTFVCRQLNRHHLSHLRGSESTLAGWSRVRLRRISAPLAVDAFEGHLQFLLRLAWVGMEYEY